MKGYIREIVVFNESGDKRFVSLKEGLNVITGESKSGKSALLEIIDYCLASSKSTVPKGEVTRFSQYYLLIIQFETYTLRVGRRSFEENGRTKMYIHASSKPYTIKELKIEDIFNDENLLSIGQAKAELTRAFGVNIIETKLDSDVRIAEPRPSIRSMTSYMFQHQNLIANKFALFYRFEDSIKREQTIKQFPVFAGWVDQKYYHYVVELDELKKRKKREERIQQLSSQTEESLKKRLSKAIREYYLLVGKQFDEKLNLSQLLRLQKQLPDFTRKSYMSEEVEARYAFLKQEREELRRQRLDIETSISNLRLTNGRGDTYTVNLKMLDSTAAYSETNKDKFDCPVCGHQVKELNDISKSLKESKEWIKSEIESVKGYGVEFHTQIRNLSKKKEKINKTIAGINFETRRIESSIKKFKEEKTLEYQVIYARAAVDHECSYVKERLDLLSRANVESDARIFELEELIAGYNVDASYSKAKAFFHSNISRIVEKLDFEKEFRPASLYFDPMTFDLYHHENKSRVYISEMGSGANWLACHLGLFLTFLHFFSVQENSSIPSFLFLDQPSQVYFPDKFFVEGEDGEKPHDIQKVEQIYKTILEELELTKKQAGYEPQVIVTDHVGELDIDGYEFKSYVRKNWRGEGNKFI